MDEVKDLELSCLFAFILFGVLMCLIVFDSIDTDRRLDEIEQRMEMEAKDEKTED